MRRFLSPGWLLAHVVMLLAAAVMVRLGVWQLDRLDELEARNAVIEERMAAPPLELGPDALPSLDPDELEYRRVTVTGSFEPDDEVLWRNRARRGVNGFHVLTPLEVAPGIGVLVDRGWIPAALDEPGDPAFAAAPGTVTVQGVLRGSVDQPSFGARDPDDGELARVFHADVERIDRQTAIELAPLYLQALTTDDPEVLPRATEPPATDEGSHLSYAVQWFSFAAIAIIGYASFLRSRLREDEAGGPVIERPATSSSAGS